MYRLVNITDKNGNTKQEFMDELIKVHPKLLGEITNKDSLRSNLFMNCLYFDWADKSFKCLRTSMVLNYKEEGNTVTVETLNSIYTFKKWRSK